MSIFIHALSLFILLQVQDLVMGQTALATNVYSWSPGDGYNSMFIVTSAGVIAIEPCSQNHAKLFVKAIKSVTNQPIKYLLISHNHWDHAKGGKVFKDEGAIVMAHAEAVQWMKANNQSDLYIPDESWEGNKKELTLGNTTIELHYMGMNHGRGNTIFLLPKEKVLYAADLVYPNAVIFSIAPDSNFKEAERTFKEILKLDFDKALWSHSGEANLLKGGTKSDVQALLTYLEDIRNGINEYVHNGTYILAVSSIMKLPKYENWSRYDTDFSLNVQKMALEIFIGPYPWRPPFKSTPSAATKFTVPIKCYALTICVLALKCLY